MKETSSAQSMTRRATLGLVVGIGALPLVGCGSDDEVASDAASSGASASSGGSASGPASSSATSSSATSSSATSSSATSSTASGNTEWASGGTAGMTDKASYPDAFVIPSACVVVASTTAGPCTTATDLEREDISEGALGLPVRLGLQLVDASCAPLAGRKVRVWHTTIDGSYTGVTPNPGFCLKDQAYAATDAFRGVGTSDADGKVYFDTCFPGWYPGRAIHIHFQVVDAGFSTKISQVFFPEDVTADIFANHPDYVGYGQPDTTFANDGVLAPISPTERERLVLDVARMSDGAMLATKVVTVV